MQGYQLESGCQVWLLSIEEWKRLEGDYPNRRNLYRNMNPVQYCRLERFEECIQGTVKIPRYSAGEMRAASFGFYLRGKGLFLIEDGNLLGLVWGKLTESAGGFTEPHSCLMRVLEALMEDDMLYLLQQEEKLAELEAGLLVELPEHFYGRMIAYRKQIRAYHSYYEQMIHIGDLMQAECGGDWQFYTARVERLCGQAELLQEYLVQIRDLYQSLLNVQQNKVMGILTVVTTIFLPLSLIAGWYGMNFPNMPEFGWRYGYPCVICICIFIAVSEICFFRRKKML